MFNDLMKNCAPFGVLFLCGGVFLGVFVECGEAFLGYFFVCPLVHRTKKKEKSEKSSKNFTLLP